MLEFDESVEWTSFNLFLDGYIELDGEIRGRGVRAMLDSGAGITVLDRKFAEEIGLSMRDAGTIKGIGGAPLYLIDRYTSGNTIYDIDFGMARLHVKQDVAKKKCILALDHLRAADVLDFRQLIERNLLRRPPRHHRRS